MTPSTAYNDALLNYRRAPEGPAKREAHKILCRIAAEIIDAECDAKAAERERLQDLGRVA